MFFHTAPADDLLIPAYPLGLATPQCAKGNCASCFFSKQCRSVRIDEVQRVQRGLKGLLPPRSTQMLLRPHAASCAVTMGRHGAERQRRALPIHEGIVVEIGSPDGRLDTKCSGLLAGVIRIRRAARELEPSRLELEAVPCCSLLCWKQLGTNLLKGSSRIHYPLRFSPAAGTSIRHLAIRVADALCTSTVVYEVHGLRTVLPTTLPHVRVLAMSLVNVKKRAAMNALRLGGHHGVESKPETRFQRRASFVKANKHQLTSKLNLSLYDILDATNGYNRTETVEHLRNLRVPYCCFCKPPTWGDLANVATRIRAIKEQVDAGTPFQYAA